MQTQETTKDVSRQENGPETGRNKQKQTRLDFTLGFARPRYAMTALLAIAFIGVLVASSACAADTDPTPGDKLNGTITNIQLFLVGIGIALAGIMIVLAGTKWMTTRGQPEEQARVKHWLFDIGVGMMLILTAPVLIEVAKGFVVK